MMQNIDESDEPLIEIAIAEEGWTTWHITIGTYGERLHGGDRPTVDRTQNQRGEPFIDEDFAREFNERARMNHESTRLPYDTCAFIEESAPDICIRGGWQFRTVGVAPDHVHLLVDAPSTIHGKDIRRWFKTWLTQLLNKQFGKRAWWAECGSTKPVKDADYLRRAFFYIEKQRVTKRVK